MFLNHALPVKKDKKSFHPDFVESRRQMMLSFLNEIVEKRLNEVLSSKTLHFQFAKFIAPVQIGRVLKVRFVNFKVMKNHQDL
jgi:hypothetical protein